jgi:hypothetical protein
MKSFTKIVKVNYNPYCPFLIYNKGAVKRQTFCYGNMCTCRDFFMKKKYISCTYFARGDYCLGFTPLEI